MLYPGGKNGAGVYQRIITMMPPHRAYIEPFLGGGAIMRLKRPAELNMGLDLSIEAIRLFLLGSEIVRPDERIRRGCGLEFLERLSPNLANRGTLVYCDPPYLLHTRASGRQYDYEMSSIDHRRLLRWAIATPCQVMISGYWSALYAQQLRKWRCCRFKVMTRGGLMDECLWCNFPEPVELHDYRYLGEGFRERERIKRKIARWKAKLERMPLLERRSLLAAMTTIASTVSSDER